MDRIINFNLLSNPANWIIIFLVLYLAALIAHVLFSASQGASALQLPEGM
jgi:hypothetical protein